MYAEKILLITQKNFLLNHTLSLFSNFAGPAVSQKRREGSLSLHERNRLLEQSSEGHRTTVHILTLPQFDN